MDFIHIKILDVIDILLVGLLMYQVYRLIRKTNAISIFTGILIVYLLWIIVRMLDMELLSLILGQVIGVGVIALIIVFQPEIRKFLFLLGERYKGRGTIISRLFFEKSYSASSGEWIAEVVEACNDLSADFTGALIVIKRDNDLTEFTSQGEKIEARTSRYLLETIFTKNSPLHDGAVIIDDGEIIAARCILPVSNRVDIPGYYGTRHRAALGVTEVTDAIVVIVSEERGQISYVANGEITYNITGKRLKEILETALNASAEK